MYHYIYNFVSFKLLKADLDNHDAQEGVQPWRHGLPEVADKWEVPLLVNEYPHPGTSVRTHHVLVLLHVQAHAQPPQCTWRTSGKVNTNNNPAIEHQ